MARKTLTFFSGPRNENAITFRTEAVLGHQISDPTNGDIGRVLLFTHAGSIRCNATQEQVDALREEIPE